MYEVEIKSLLGSKENADRLKAAMKDVYPDAKLVGQGKQLNHYFVMPEDTSKLAAGLTAVLKPEQSKAIADLLAKGKKTSLRTRDANGKVLIVVKSSVGDDTSANGVRRVELEYPVAKTLAELDQVLLEGGLSYQAKWSREREEYAAGDLHICIDKNAGYGYLAEFEKVISDESMLDATHKSLIEIMAALGVSELPQDRLERMFAHYNAHWAEYYGTDKTFTLN